MNEPIVKGPEETWINLAARAVSLAVVVTPKGVTMHGYPKRRRKYLEVAVFLPNNAGPSEVAEAVRLAGEKMKERFEEAENETGS